MWWSIAEHRGESSALPEGVYQEIWGALIAYNIVRMEMAQAAQDAKVQPTDLGFVRAFHFPFASSTQKTSSRS